MAQTKYIREADGKLTGHAALSDTAVGRIELIKSDEYDATADGSVPFGTLEFRKYLADGKSVSAAKDVPHGKVTRHVSKAGKRYLQTDLIPIEGTNYQFTMFYNPADERRKLPECYTFVVEGNEQDENFVATSNLAI